MSFSSGECKTIITDPMRQRAQPTLPTIPSRSCKKNDARTALLKEKTQKKLKSVVLDVFVTLYNENTLSPSISLFPCDGTASHWQSIGCRGVLLLCAPYFLCYGGSHFLCFLPNDDTEGTEGSDENRRCKRIGCKVGNLSCRHCWSMNRRYYFFFRVNHKSRWDGNVNPIVGWFRSRRTGERA